MHRDGHSPLKLGRALRSAEYWLLLTAALAAGFGVTAWLTISTTMAGLLLSSLPKYAPLYARARDAGVLFAYWSTVAASILTAGIAAIAATLLGHFIWWLWGL